MELINMLTEQLRISDEQARGGAGLLFKMAKDKLESGDFEQITASVSEADSLADAAPGSDLFESALGGLASGLSSGESNLGDLAGLVGGFTKLGLEPDMLGHFVPIVLSFVKGKGGDGVQNILSKVLK